MPEPPLEAHSPLRPPQQPRSRRTLERLVKAALDILEEEGPEGVTVQAVVARARSSVGSFYARFGGKDDLLEYLGTRVWDEVLERWNESVAARSWSDMALEDLVGGTVGLLFDVRRSRLHQLRALDRITGGSSAFEAFREHLLGDLEALLLERRDEMVHETPELAVRLGLRAVLGVTDSALVLANGDDAAHEPIVQECRQLLMGYLTGRAPEPSDESVEFFDVWG